MNPCSAEIDSHTPSLGLVLDATTTRRQSRGEGKLTLRSRGEDNIGVVEEAVDHGGGDFVAQDLGPGVERLV